MKGSPLSETHPELAKQAHGWDPRQLTAGSNKVMDWLCPMSHKFSASVNNRTRGTNCPYCANKKVLKGFNDLATLSPDLAKEAYGWDASTVSKKSGKILQWRCSEGHIWKSSVSNRAAGNGCPVCSGKKVVHGFNDLTTTNFEVAREAFGWDPKEVSAGSHAILPWKCERGHVWKTQVYNRGIYGNGCPTCAGKVIIKGFNDLETLYPEIAKEAFGWNPSQVAAASNKKMKWKCKLGHVYSSPVGRRTNQQSGCPICAHKIVLAGFNDLATTNPELAREADGWDPTKYVEGNNHKFNWICSEGHKWKASINLRSKGTGCPSCAKSGFDPNIDGFLYFIKHENWQMFQIGITNKPEERLGSHKKLGWELLEIRGPMDGHLTQEWETTILRMLKAKGADLANSHIAGKFDGYSEAWSISKFRAKSILELMQITEEFEKDSDN